MPVYRLSMHFKGLLAFAYAGRRETSFGFLLHAGAVPMSRRLRTSTLAVKNAAFASPETARMFAQAQQWQQQGNLVAAEAKYREVLARSPRHADTLHYLGTIHYQQGRLDQAAELMAQSIVADGNRAAFYSNLGLVLQAKGMLEQAEAVYRRALALQPSYPEASNNLGTALQAQGRLEEALSHYSHALTLWPEYADAHGNAGTVLKKQGKLDQAIQHYQTAVSLNPRSAESHYNLGNALFEQKKFADAVEHYKAAVASRPHYPDAYVNWANVLVAQSKTSGSAESQKLQQEAIGKYREALRLAPQNVEAHYGLAHALQVRDELDEAIKHYRCALEINPRYADAYVNWGNAVECQGRVDEAIPLYERGCILFDEQAGPTVNPEHVLAHMNYAMALLRNGNLAEGFAHYEWRYKDTSAAAYNDFPQPLWEGGPLGGARILLRSEQGLGDSLQFLRYVSLVRDAGGQVILQIQPCLRRLAEQIESITVICKDDPVPSFDTHCSLMSLPKALGTTLTTIPVPYLKVPEEEQRSAADRTWPKEGLKVGLVWSGNPDHVRDRTRSLSFPQVEPLLAVEGVHFFSLQIDGASGTRFGDLQLVAENMADTAAKVARLDLVITADTAMAHLAGSLDVPTWVMLSYTPDWRWLQERTDSPWYPSVRLFRQPQLGDWTSVVDDVRQALATLSSQ